MNDVAEFFCVALVMMIVGLAFGFAWSGEDWRNDCEKLGMHRSDGKAYECKLKGKP